MKTAVTSRPVLMGRPVLRGRLARLRRTLVVGALVSALAGCGASSVLDRSQAPQPLRAEIVSVHEALNGRARSSASWDDASQSLAADAADAAPGGGMGLAAAAAPRGLHAAVGRAAPAALHAASFVDRAHPLSATASLNAGAPEAALPTSSSVLLSVHLASYRSAATAQAGWEQLFAAAPAVLNGLEPRLERVDLGPDKGEFLRLKAGPVGSRAEANAVCDTLRAQGRYCALDAFNGEALRR